MFHRVIDRTGLQYGRLTVLSRAANTPQRAARWLCQCECGTQVVVRGHLLGSGDTQSCGCLAAERFLRSHTKHGMARTPTYESWKAMKHRVTNPNGKDWSDYGGRGIDMDPRWQASFEAFLADMGVRPAHRTLDRIDNERGYWPDNCRWATTIEQRHNRRPARKVA
jgi:hypothetical protein